MRSIRGMGGWKGNAGMCMVSRTFRFPRKPRYAFARSAYVKSETESVNGHRVACVASVRGCCAAERSWAVFWERGVEKCSFVCTHYVCIHAFRMVFVLEDSSTECDVGDQLNLAEEQERRPMRRLIALESAKERCVRVDRRQNAQFDRSV